MNVRFLCALSLTLVLGCEDGARSRSSLASPSASGEPRIGGRVVDNDAGEGALAFLLADSAARDVDTLAGSVIDSVEVSQDGRFAFTPGASGDWVLVSAPGKALARVRPASDLEVRLRPEARLSVSVGEPYAFSLVLDAGGAPLPLPAEQLVSTGDGILTAPRLPAGQFTLLVQSADGTRYAVRDVTVGEGEHRLLSLELAADAVSARRFLSAVGGAAKLHPLHTEEGR